MTIEHIVGLSYADRLNLASQARQQGLRDILHSDLIALTSLMGPMSDGPEWPAGAAWLAARHGINACIVSDGLSDPWVERDKPETGLGLEVFVETPDAGIAIDAPLLVPVQPEQPWRLDNAWQTGGLGGSVLRSAAMEHIVRQVDQPLGVYVASGDVAGHVLNVSTSHISDSQDNDAQVIERAWRKYCHHQLDMTAEDQALVRTMPITHNVLSHGCNPGSLKK